MEQDTQQVACRAVFGKHDAFLPLVNIMKFSFKFILPDNRKVLRAGYKIVNGVELLAGNKTDDRFDITLIASFSVS
jgi:hypothetical protein